MTPGKLIGYCKERIEEEGPLATVVLRIPGRMEKGQQRKRLFPGGPLGKIIKGKPARGTTVSVSFLAQEVIKAIEEVEWVK